MPRSSKQGNDIAVQGTNDSSIVSKCSIVTQGYFQDDFLTRFICKTARRAPLINRGYYIRASVIDDALKQFVSVHCDKKNQIISLGAGFDSAFFRLHANGHLVNTTFYEVDFPDVVQRKASIIKNSPNLRRQLIDEVEDNAPIQGGIYLTSANYHLLGIDLTNLHLLENSLVQTGADHGLPTFLLSECVLTYMEVECSNAVIQWAASSFPNAVFLTYEQIHPDDAFGIVMLNHFDKLNSSLKAIQTYPNIEAQLQRFYTLGWQDARAIDMNSYFYKQIPLKEIQRIEQLEPFDEFEEWHLKCSHYAVIAGCNGTCIGIMKHFEQDVSLRPCDVENECIPVDPYMSFHQTPCTTIPLCHLRRYGHASCILSLDRVIVLGGFGEAGSKHARLGDMVIFDVHSGTWHTVSASSGSLQLEPQMHHTLTAISGGNQFVLFGGRSSPTRPSKSSFIITLHTELQTSDKEVASCDTTRQTITEEISDCTAKTEYCDVNKDSNGYIDGNRWSHSTDNNELTSVQNVDVTSCREQCSIINDMGSGRGCVDKQSQAHAVRNEDINNTPMMHLPIRTHLPTTSTNISFTYHLEEVECNDVPMARWRHSATHTTVNGKEYVVIYGGRSTDCVLGDCWIFDVSERHWQQLDITGNQPPCCHSHTVSVWQDTKIVIAGGLGPNLQPLSSVHIIDLKTKICQEMELTPTLTPRYSHTAHVLHNSLLLVGGVNPHGAQCYSMVLIDLQAATCIQHSLPVCHVERPMMLHNHTSQMLSHTSILILGGGGNCFSFGTHLNNTPIQINLPHYFQEKIADGMCNH